MLKLFLFLSLAGLSFAQPTPTPISDTLYDQFSNRYNGSLTISLSTPALTSGSAPILSVIKVIQIRNGVLSVSLIPNDTGAPGGTQYVLQFGSGAVKLCTIPTTGTPIILAGHCTDATVAPQFGVAIPALPAGGPYCLQGNNMALNWVSGTCGGGSGGGLFLSSINNSQLSSLTNSQLSSLAN